MNKSIPNVVILPDSYNSQKEGYPVLYLLHGATGNYKYWLNMMPKIKTYVNKYDFIVVCPDGGYTSWYFDSPIDETMKYETYISKELISAVDTLYNTLGTRNSRAITGASMGGHGAFYLSFRNPEIWGAAGSMSGGVDIRPFPNNWDIYKRLGSFSENKKTWDEYTVINLVHLLKSQQPKLIFDCGNEDFFVTVNRKLHQKLLENNVPHDYIERPGKHDGNYWPVALNYQLFYFNNFFNLTSRN